MPSLIDNYEEMRQVYERWLTFKGDENLLRIIYGSVGSFFYPGSNLVWMVLIGGSSSGKSELILTFLRCEKHIKLISTMTKKSLLSGFDSKQRGVKSGDCSLLKRLNGKILMVKDLSSVTTSDPKEAKSVFADLREVYDQVFNKAVGNSESEISFEGRVGFLGAGTSALDDNENVWNDSKIGSRFIVVRPTIDPKALAERSFWNISNTEKMRAELQGAAVAFFEKLPDLTRVDKVIKYSLATLVNDACNTLVVARTTVCRDGYSHEVSKSVKTDENPARVRNSMISLLGCMKYLGADANELERTTYRIMLDCIPRARRDVLEAFALCGVNDAKDLPAFLKLSRTYTDRIVEDLEMLGVINTNKRTKGTDFITDPFLTHALKENQSLVLMEKANAARLASRTFVLPPLQLETPEEAAQGGEDRQDPADSDPGSSLLDLPEPPGLADGGDPAPGWADNLEPPPGNDDPGQPEDGPSGSDGDGSDWFDRYVNSI